MRRKKRRMFGMLLMLTALLIMQIPADLAQAASDSDYNISGTTLISYLGSDARALIPSGVEVIGQSAFENQQTLEQVVLPNSLRRIDPYAFWGCNNLKTISFGRKLNEIGDYSFTSCQGLKELVIPSNIASIGIRAFADCVNLTDITIPASVSYIHETAFDGCKKLVIHCEDGSYASKYAVDFYKRQSEMAEYEDVPDYNTGSSQGTDENSGDEFDPEEEEGLLGATFVVGNQAVVFMDNREPTVYQGMIRQSDKDGFSGKEPSKYRIVDGSIIAEQAYYKDSSLEEIVLPGEITQIGEFAFARSRAASFAVSGNEGHGSGLVTIGFGAFYHCDRLSKVQLPDTVRKVEPEAFTHTAWVDSFLAGSDREKGDFLISGGVLVAYRGQESEVTIPDSVRVIAAGCFKDHEEIRKLVLPESLTDIGEEAFAYCAGLENVSWPGKIRTIADRAFCGCGLSKAVLPATLESIGLQAFDSFCETAFLGETPKKTYEETAQRLSNRELRLAGSGADTGERGVKVTGLSGAQANLAGENGAYALELAAVETTVDRQRAVKAFARNLEQDLPLGAFFYRMQLTDESGIPITRLGKQTLKVTMPLPKILGDRTVSLYRYDGDGQLDKLEAAYGKKGEDCYLIFETGYVSDLILIPEASELLKEQLEEITEQVQAYAGRPAAMSAAWKVQEQDNNPQKQITLLMTVKWILGGGLLLAGLFLALSRVR